MSKHKLTNSWGVYDAYKWLRKNKWLNIKSPVKEHDFYRIIRTIGNIQKEHLSEFKDVVFPFGMGKITTEYIPTYVKIVNGKIKTNRRIDWKLTKKEGKRVYQENEYYTCTKYHTNKQIKLY